MQAQLMSLDRSEVVTAALRAMDERRLDPLTLRQLGDDPGARSSPWQHVPRRGELLDAVAALLLCDVHEDLDVTSSWQGYLHGLAHGLRRVALQHPRCFPLVATPPATAPWLWPPVRDMALVERILSTLRMFGFTEIQAAETYRAFICFLMGQLLLEASLRQSEASTHVQPSHDGVPWTLLPVSGTITLRLRSALTEDRDNEEFDIGLEQLLDRLELRTAPRRCRVAASRSDQFAS